MLKSSPGVLVGANGIAAMRFDWSRRPEAAVALVLAIACGCRDRFSPPSSDSDETIGAERDLRLGRAHPRRPGGGKDLLRSDASGRLRRDGVPGGLRRPARLRYGDDLRRAGVALRRGPGQPRVDCRDRIHDHGRGRVRRGSYLVAWQDGSQYDVYFRRVGTDGKPLGTATRPWANDPSNEYDPAVAFDGTNFVVAFRIANGQIVASRVGPTGALVDTTPKVIVAAPPSSSDYPLGPRLAFDGTNYQLVWQSNSSLGKLMSVRFTPALVVVAGSMATLTPPTVWSNTAPALAFGGGQHLLAWTELATSTDATPTIRAARLDLAGTLSAAITVVPPLRGKGRRLSRSTGRAGSSPGPRAPGRPPTWWRACAPRASTPRARWSTPRRCW